MKSNLKNQYFRVPLVAVLSQGSLFLRLVTVMVLA